MLLFPAVLRYVDFSRSGIWGKLGKGVQGICLKSCAKFPPNRRAVPSFPQIALCFPSFTLRPQPFDIMHLLCDHLISPGTYHLCAVYI